MSSNLFPTYLYRDPLLHPTKLVLTRSGPQITLPNNIDENVEGDYILHLFINTLDEEIFKQMPEGLGELGEALWVDDQWSNLMIQVSNEARKHGWCMVQFYKDGETRDNKRWRVFSVQQYTDWIREPSGDETKIIRAGVKFAWGDDLGNTFKEELRFDDPLTYLIKWNEGNGMSVFAFPDLSQDILSLTYELRQMRGQLTFTASKPSFLHFIYGTEANDDNVDELDDQLKFIDTTAGIGAPEGVLKEIKSIQNNNIDIIDPAIDRQLQFVSAATRLPVSYFIGEKMGSGMSDMGEKTDMLKTIQKKEHIFNKMKIHIQKMYDLIYDMSIDELELPSEEVLEGVETDNEERNQDVNSGEEVN